ncbi:DUF4270 domain-containing protein [Flavobacterium sp. NRK1]|uniref:DUF4270 domain-containing protein n=1 Tax=Flavobacterium sp. NRK1 TaxID=2954929 RepID=UPI0020935ADC|nr:DUF4270 domain-containing protein [Flavobacterium sp. NRK1]MCO6147809.1 DUF4270 domain-containing protein [Flavobacterium sp. NRK1]
MTNSSFLKKLIFALSIVFFVSCDKDFNELGSDIVGDDVHSDMIKADVNVVAYDRPTGAVQSNNLTLNQLGVYDNPVFGKTIAHFVTQLEIPSGSENPTLYSPVIDSVYLYVPYYSKATGSELDESDTNNGTSTLYELDSVYGNPNAKFNLKLYRNGFYLRDTDPGAADKVQRYYSDDFAMVESLLVGAPLAENEAFTFSPLEVKRIANPKGTNPATGEPNAGTPRVVERLAPGIFMNLDKAAMQDALFSNANRGNLLNNNIFKNYFRGLYFKVEQVGNDAVMAVPKFSEGIITIKYHDYEIGLDGVQGTDILDKTMTFNLKTNTINFYENTYKGDFSSAIASSDAVEGDSRLYIKGGAGSMAIINLVDAGLNALTEAALGERILVNEANLVFYVDNNSATGMGQSVADGTKLIAPLRLYLYDLENRKPVYDYYADGTSSNAYPKYNKYIHGGVIDTLDNGTIRYKIRVTDHVNNIIKGDSINHKLGLVVTESINVVSNYKLKTAFTEGDTEVKEIPLSAVQHPFGTVLYGSNVPVGEQDKRVKLEIFYSKPK